MTLLAVSVVGDAIAQIRRDVAEAAALGAELIELRVDRMPGVCDDDILSLRESPAPPMPLILTIRSEAEGGDWSGPDAARIDRLIKLSPIADYIDVELATWLHSDAIRQQLRAVLGHGNPFARLASESDVPRTPLRKLILSCHDFTGRPATLTKLHIDLLSTESCDVPKLAWRARTIRDNFEAFEMMRLRHDRSAGRSPGPPIVICMGPEGLPSRVLAKKFGAFATFASLRPGVETAPGQPTISTLKGVYRWDAIDAKTAVYGLIGDPVEHSIGPQLHNGAFAESGINAVYLPLKVNPGYESFAAFVVEALARPWADFRGFSVTIPHKENALRFIQRYGGAVDDLAARIGAVNTITVGPDSELVGFNTDHDAALQTIASGLGRSTAQLAGLTVAVLGAGGVARAIVAGLCGVGAQVTIYNRTAGRAAELAKAFSCVSAPWEQRAESSADLIVNCTSVGLAADRDASPLPAETLQPHQAVFDTIYTPPETKLLQQAKARGCTTIEGAVMFALQAQAQFELWTGQGLASAFFLERTRQLLSSGR